MRRVLIVIIFLILGFFVLLTFFSDYFVEKSISGGPSQLRFVSLAGNYKVYIDDKFIGEVPSKSEKVFTKIASGTRRIKVIRESDVENFFFVLDRELFFMPYSEVSLEWEAGPTFESSNGILKYFSSAVNTKTTEVVFETFPKDAVIFLDSQPIESSVVELNSTRPVQVKVAADDRFETKEFSISVKDEINHTVPQNLRLIVEVYLYKKPITS